MEVQRGCAVGQLGAPDLGALGELGALDNPAAGRLLEVVAHHVLVAGLLADLLAGADAPVEVVPALVGGDGGLLAPALELLEGNLDQPRVQGDPLVGADADVSRQAPDLVLTDHRLGDAVVPGPVGVGHERVVAADQGLGLGVGRAPLAGQGACRCEEE